MHKKKFYEKYLKRPIDFISSLLTLIVLLPALIVVSIFVRWKLGSPVIFTQQRPGLNEKIFKLYKFRTMTNQKDKSGVLLPDEVRLTKFGKFLRSTSLDELPSLLNIIKGDLSIVGPRPLLVDYLNFYYESEKMRHFVRPGLTGLAQINGRNYMSWEDKFEYDIYYVDNLSFMTDMKIILKTIYKVLKRNNVETGSSINHNGITYQPLNIERAEMRKMEK